MAVRFLPPPDERGVAAGEDRGDLAEVIQLRETLQQRNWGESRSSHGERAHAEVTPSTEAGRVQERSRDREPGGEPEVSDEARSSYDDAVRILGRRARSSGELRDELLRLNHDQASVEAVIDEFERSLYLDDPGLARSLTERLRESKRASRAQIRVKLIARKLPDAVIEAALGELNADEEFALLRKAAVDRARKLSGLDRQTAERRLLGFLARRGWSGEPAMRAVRAALDEAPQHAGGVRFR